MEIGAKTPKTKSQAPKKFQGPKSKRLSQFPGGWRGSTGRGGDRSRVGQRLVSGGPDGNRKLGPWSFPWSGPAGEPPALLPVRTDSRCARTRRIHQSGMDFPNPDGDVHFPMKKWLVLWLLFPVWETAAAGPAFRLDWTNNLLTVTSPTIPGGKLEIWYLEAFLRPGAQQRDWGQSRLAHQTELVSATPDGNRLEFRTRVEPSVLVQHEVGAGADELDFTFRLTNTGATNAPVQWFQPACIRVAGFTGRDQTSYPARSFVFTARGLTPLDRIVRTTNALYLGGQVYLPPWTRPADANPRPLAGERLTNGLIGCVSGDGRWLLATASDRTHELFEGVYVCLHSDPLIGGLAPGETRTIRQKLYLLPNDPEALLRRYRQDFPDATATAF